MRRLWRGILVVLEGTGESLNTPPRQVMEAEHRLRVALTERALAAERRLATVEELGASWVGFDDSHPYGDALLKAVLSPAREGS